MKENIDPTALRVLLAVRDITALPLDQQCCLFALQLKSDEIDMDDIHDRLVESRSRINLQTAARAQ